MLQLEELINNILTAASGKRAWEWVSRLAQYNRVQGSDGYRQAAELIKGELKELGFKEIEHFQSVLDGKTKTWEWTPSYQWEINSGELWLEEPDKEKLCDYEEIAVNIITHSKSCDIITKVVDVGTGTSIEELEAKDVNGKFLLMNGEIYSNLELLENSGAVGVIFYPRLERTRGDIDKVIYNSFFPDSERISNVLSGFSVSYKQGMYLKDLLSKGQVKVHAKIDATLKEGVLDVISAAIQGSEFPEQEFIVIAHLCHPFQSANDNASGSAGLLELARTFSTLITNNTIAPPKRTIRFVWVPEFNGTIPWAKYHETTIKNSIGSINLDMIGEHPLKIGNPLLINATPYSIPTILNDITHFFVREIADHPKGVAINGSKAPMSYRMTSFDGGSDHVVFIDAYFGVPSHFIGHDDPHWHSSMDTIEYCDSSELQRVIGIAGCVAYLFASFDEKWLNLTWPILYKGIYNRLGTTASLIDELVINYGGRSQLGEDYDYDLLYTLGSDLIDATESYERSLLESINKIEFKAQDNFFIKMASAEVNEWTLNQKNLFERKLNELTTIDDLKPITNYSDKYQLTVKGPFPIKRLIKITKEPLFKEFTDTLKNQFKGSIIELINLIALEQSVLRISSLLTLHYKALLFPKLVQDLLIYLEDHNYIKKISN